jgi:hypothetical protein
MQTRLEAYAKAKRASKSKNARSVSMTLVAVLTVNRELGTITQILV